MALKDDLEQRVREIFKQQWTTRDGNVVPSDDSIKLSNDAVKLKATVLYADLADSTVLVDGYKDWFAAEIYKTFLHCAAKVIAAEGGTITAYDGDRIMAVFLGDMKNTTAARAALKINWTAKNLVQALKDQQFPKDTFKLNHVCGIDTSDLFVAKTGIRGSNDLVWVGRAANYAAKLAALDHNKPTWITKAVYDALETKCKISSDGRDMWVKHTWNAMNKMEIYASTYWWRL
ncbi:adenylate/guanylate cyclase domain-containing protein [Sphingobium fuliginis]|jgi:class 3 adenylate cyclase|uniref:adenylate/guanylate cyclase domain-containing protein n=1 Tax=Sphingobium fuliginis (strain ATCC 27551) TaxID=336203 RepID=UPI000C086C64|nr:adenylate/guanylate cyclase domain-containing protein [Sphingobium fuliginis]